MFRLSRLTLVLVMAWLSMAVLALAVQAQTSTPPQPGTSTVVLKEAGGALSSSDGRVTITFSSDVTRKPATITLSSAVSQIIPQRFTVIGSPFAIDAQDLTTAPMQIIIRYTVPVTVSEKDLIVIYYDATAEKWLPLSTKIDMNAHIATASATQLGQFALISRVAITSLPSSAVIVDDLGAGFAKFGLSATWHEAITSTQDFWAGHMWWTLGQISVRSNYATWTPVLNAGLYDVYAFVGSYNTDTNNARYQIVHQGITSIRPISQSVYFAEWVKIGTYYFGSGAGNYVLLDDVTGESLLKRIGFDAIAFVPSRVYLPLVMNNYPPPPKKEFTGIHLGNREGQGPEYDWTDAMLQPIDGRSGGVYPRTIVVQSKEVWQIDRPTAPPPASHCEVAGAHPRSDRPRVWQYLTNAAKDGVTILIRIAPAPGNFLESIIPSWRDPTLVPTRTLITTDTPAGGDYCNGKWEDFRAFDDIVKEMDAIHDINQIHGWPENSYYFIPANEPNLEWYPLGTTPFLSSIQSWNAMDDYFSALIAYARQNHPELRILTPPMGPAQYAEGINWGAPGNFCSSQLVGGNQKGYDIMLDTYMHRVDGFYGYSWINYFTQGREYYDSCQNGGFHVSYHFPNFMQLAMIQEGFPGYIAEPDLCSWFPFPGGGNCFNTSPLSNKEDDPWATATSLTYFFQAEWQNTNAIPALWLLNNNQNDIRDFEWHEAFTDTNNSFYEWFTTWWDWAE